MISAGILLFRRTADAVEVFLVHPGGPFFAARNEGAWSVPKGIVDDGEDPLAAARREFLEETGASLDACGGGDPIDLGTVRQKGGKIVRAFAVEGDWPGGAELRSNTFSLEWPARSGRMREFPEVDRGGFFSIADARRLLNPAQAPFLDVLLERLAG